MSPFVIISCSFIYCGLDKHILHSHILLMFVFDRQTLSETKTDYKLGVHPKDQSITIQSLEVGAQEKTITTKIELR